MEGALKLSGKGTGLWLGTTGGLCVFFLLFMALGKSLILDFSLSAKKWTVLISLSEVF